MGSSEQYTKWKAAFALFALKLEDGKTELFHACAFLTFAKCEPLYDGDLPSITIQGDRGPVTIRPSEEWRYLGFIFNSRMTMTPHINWWVNKASGSVRALRMLGNSVRSSPSLRTATSCGTALMVRSV